MLCYYLVNSYADIIRNKSEKYIEYKLPQHGSLRNTREYFYPFIIQIIDPYLFLSSNFYKNALNSNRPKEVWKIIHRILNPNPKNIIADPNTLNNQFFGNAKRLTGKHAAKED